MSFLQRVLHRPFFIRLFHWEFWSFTAVYALIYPVFGGLVLRERFRYFFSAANPYIRNGGFLMESKIDIQQMIPQGFSPDALFFPAGTAVPEILEAVRNAGMKYPLVIKPDIGMRGLAVRKLESDSELAHYAPLYEIDFLVQAFVPYEKEAGIFYYRYPGTDRGNISGIVSKEFLAVEGDGQSSLQELLRKDKRFVLQMADLREEYGSDMDMILPAGEQKLLVPYGNHARGARFLDDTHLADDALRNVIDTFCKQLPEFYFGRLDIRYHDWEELRSGRRFAVIEVNGAGSEPTHIYDPRHSIFFAWKEIIRHWLILWRISRANHRRGFLYMSLREGSRMFRENRFYVRKLKFVHQRLLAKAG